MFNIFRNDDLRCDDALMLSNDFFKKTGKISGMGKSGKSEFSNYWK